MSLGSFITLKFAARCADCRAKLPAGTRARYYPPNPGFERGRVFGLDCHPRKDETPAPAPAVARG